MAPGGRAAGHGLRRKRRRALWRGSSGSSVRDLQTKLNQNGYKLDVDGVFGNKTYNAVLDYQRKNKLAVDGVVGNET